MKKKYFILLLAVAFIFASSVGGALWIILSENQVGISLYTKKDVTVSAALKPIYYGNEISFETTTATCDGITVAGEWKIKKYNKEELVAKGTPDENNLLQAQTPVTAVFEPDDKRLYNGAETQLTVPMYPVALYGSNSYSTLDYALTDANQAANGGTVYALALGKTVDEGVAKEAKTISRVTAIDSNVTLFLPYTEDYLDTDEKGYTALEPVRKNDKPVEPTNTERYEFSMFDFNPETYKINQIYVASGHTLTNNGTVMVAGEVSGGAGGSTVNSMTACYHSQINLLGSAQIINNSKLTCYGYITGESNSKITAKSGSTTKVVFSVVEHRGGAGYFGMIVFEETGTVDPTTHIAETVRNQDVINDIAGKAISGVFGGGDFYPELTTAPFNRFYVETVMAEFTIEYGATVTGYANLYADNVKNETEVALVGKLNDGKNSTIELSPNSKMVCNYDYVQKISGVDTKTKQHTFDFYGSIKLNPFTLDLTVKKSVSFITATIKVHMKTNNVFFPISNHLHVNLHAYENGQPATVDLSSQPKIKLLPGSVVNVGENVTVNADSIAVYKDKAQLPDAAGPYNVQYNYNNSTPAQLNVAGTLNVDNFGGEVTPTSDTAVINIKKSASAMSKEMAYVYPGSGTDNGQGVEIAGMTLPCKEVKFLSDDFCTHYATGDTFNENGAEQVNATLEAGTYYGAQISGNNYAWLPAFNVTLNANGGAFGDGATTKIIEAKAGVTVSDQEKPTREHYHFTHWCTNASCENDANCADRKEGVLYADAELYAIWEENAYYINYKYVLPDGSITDSGIAKTKFTVKQSNQVIEFPNTTNIPTDGNGNEYSFSGWYTAKDGAIIDQILATEYLAKVSKEGDSVTIYAVWVADPVYTVNFITNNADFAVASTKITDNDTASLVPQQLTGRNEDENYSHYFEGWYIDRDLTIPYANWAQLRDGAKPDGEETLVRTLYAKWVDKAMLSFEIDYSIADGSPESVTIEPIYLGLSQQWNLSIYNDKFENNDKNVQVIKYFTGWEAVDGNASITDNIVEISANTKIKATFANKFVLSFDTSSPTAEDGLVGTFKAINSIADVYLVADQSFELSVYNSIVNVNDNDVEVNKYFKGWITTSGAVINGSTITVSSNVTVSVNWGTKYAIVIGNVNTTNCLGVEIKVNGNTYINTNSGYTIYVKVGVETSIRAQSCKLSGWITSYHKIELTAGGKPVDNVGNWNIKQEWTESISISGSEGEKIIVTVT